MFEQKIKMVVVLGHFVACRQAFSGERTAVGFRICFCLAEMRSRDLIITSLD